ncbi:MAG: hypothetical protein RL139_69 [Gemmatimonadota bacterium]|jgi:hypothetical protein
MLQGAFKIIADGGQETEVRWDGRDIRAWEARFDKSWIATIDQRSVTDVAFIAYAASRRAGDPRTWEQFNDQVVDVVEVDAQPLPKSKGTRKGRTGGSS